MEESEGLEEARRPVGGAVGLVLDLAGVLRVTFLVYFVTAPRLGFDPGRVPGWARP